MQLSIRGMVHNGHISMGHNTLGGYPFVFYPTAVCGIMAFIVFCMVLDNRLIFKQ